jgi:hypothetical protein
MDGATEKLKTTSGTSPEFGLLIETASSPPQTSETVSLNHFWTISKSISDPVENRSFVS